MFRLPRNFPNRVLVPQAGYPNGNFSGGSFDPAMGRGYRAGDQRVIEANQTVALVNHGLVSGYFRWKVMVACGPADAGSYTANQSYFLRFSVTGKNENDAIERLLQVQLNNAQVTYVPGRSLEVLVTNQTDQPLVAQFSLDEATPGLSPFRSTEHLSVDTGTETALNIPDFAVDMQLFSLTGGVGWQLRGYDVNGVLVYDETLAAPRSAQIPIAPTLHYTIEPTAGLAQVAVVQYNCVG